MADVGMAGDGRSEKKFILALDVGTSNVRSLIYDKSGNIAGRSSQTLKIIHPEPRAVEIEPESILTQVCATIKGALSNAGINANEVIGMGMSLQRSTFILWHKETGEPLHNFIVWQDTRCEYLEKMWNHSYTMRVVKAGSKALHAASRSKRFLAASVIKFASNHASMRLLWVLENHPKIKELAKQGKVRFGTLETWLIWKLTGEKVYAAEISHAASSGIYDPYLSEWSGFFCGLLSFPLSLFPPVWSTDADYGSVDEKYFGHPIPITAPLGDQQAAFFGHCKFDVGDCKLTMGTGAFFDVNVGGQPHASVKGFYPLTWYQIQNEIVYLGEGCANTSGDAVQWMQNLGLFDKVEDCESMAESVDDSNGVYFVPAFNGLQAPTNDFSACGSLFGLTAKAGKAHIVRAVLESLAFKNKDMYDAMCSEIKHKPNAIAADGGVCSNNFIMQLTSDLIGLPIERGRSDLGSLGAAFAAGLKFGFWKNRDDIKKIVSPEKTFYPNTERGKAYKAIMHRWNEAVKRSMNWY